MTNRVVQTTCFLSCSTLYVIQYVQQSWLAIMMIMYILASQDFEFIPFQQHRLAHSSCMESDKLEGKHRKQSWLGSSHS